MKFPRRLLIFLTSFISVGVFSGMFSNGAIAALHNDISNNTPCGDAGSYCAVGTGQSVCSTNILIYTGGWCGNNLSCCYGGGTVKNYIPCWDIGTTYYNGTGYCAVGGSSACGGNKFIYSGGWCGSGKVCCLPITGPTGKDGDCSHQGQVCSSGLFCTPVDFGSGMGCEPAGWCGNPPAQGCSNGNLCDEASHTCYTPATATQTPVPPTPTITPSPTPSGPTPTPTPLFTTGDITVHFEAIDKDNFPAPGGQNHTNRYIVMFLYLPKQDGTVDFSGLATYTLPPAQVYLSSSNTNSNDFGFFRNKTFPMKGVPSGSYYILVKAKEGSLVEEVGNSPIPIVGGSSNIIVNIDNLSQDQTLPTTPPLMEMGDIITDCTGTDPASCSYNSIDLLDYSALKDCFGPNLTSADCLKHNLSNNGYDKYNIAELNDANAQEGLVNGVDYTILLKHFLKTGVGGVTQNGGKDH